MGCPRIWAKIVTACSGVALLSWILYVSLVLRDLLTETEISCEMSQVSIFSAVALVRLVEIFSVFGLGDAVAT